jgi:hypothetical protein
VEEGLKNEIEQIRVDNLYTDLSCGERTKMLKKLLGPLLEPGVLTPKESAYFFLASAHDKSIRVIAKELGVAIGTAQKVVASARGKIQLYRRGRFWESA